jgi:toxin YoeB
MRQIAFHPNAFDDLKYWAENDIKLLRRLIDLIKDTQRDPFNGIGKH